MSDLFTPPPAETPQESSAKRPLAARMRPQTLEEIAGQEHILGPGKLLRRAIEADRLSSLILYGPPGCGKTSLAEVIARSTRRAFDRTSGVLSNVAGLRQSLEAARQRRVVSARETILFIDEIHRFNKAQQDVLLPYVEEGAVTLIGATTHNPFFFINNPLVSRSQVFQLEPLSEAAIETLLQRALQSPVGLAHLPLVLEADAAAHLAAVCEGDARRALNALEIAALTTPPGPDGKIHITRAVTEESIQKKAVVYDHDEDGHYDTISAFIKSVRGLAPTRRFIAGKMIYAAKTRASLPAVGHWPARYQQCRPRGLTGGGGTAAAVSWEPEARLPWRRRQPIWPQRPKAMPPTWGEAALADVKKGAFCRCRAHCAPRAPRAKRKHENYRPLL